MTEHRVTIVERPSAPDRIVRVGTGTQPGSANRWWRTEEVARAMARGERFFVVGATSGRRSEVYLTADGLRSAADDDTDNNLDALPDQRSAPAVTRSRTAYPGDNLQTHVDALEAEDATLLLTAGDYPLSEPLRITGKRRFTLRGEGWGTRLIGLAADVQVRDCDDLAIRDLTVELATVPPPTSELDRRGAISVIGGDGTLVADCLLTCADRNGPPAACVVARDGARVEVARSRLAVGAGQIGIDSRAAKSLAVVGSRLLSESATPDGPIAARPIVVEAHHGPVSLTGNVMTEFEDGVSLEGSVLDGFNIFGGRARIADTEIRTRVMRSSASERTAVYVTGFRSIELVDNVLYANGDPTYGVKIDGLIGYYLLIRGILVSGWATAGFHLHPVEPPFGPGLWHVRETMTFGQAAVDAVPEVSQEFNRFNPE